MARPRPSLDSLVEGLRAGDTGALSRAITLAESQLPADRPAAHTLLDRVMPYTGGAYRLGITGSPGVGKSTFIEAFGLHALTAGARVAVLAVDPSSPLSHGSILGDKTRMQLLAQHAGAFIRPSPASGALGGVARASRETLLLCEAAGYDLIIVETVGVGQSELIVRDMVDAFVLLQLPGAGDELQGIKRGIIEMADLIVVTKADPDQPAALQRARLTQADLRLALHLQPPPVSGEPVEVLLCSAPSGVGVAEVWQQLMHLRQAMQTSGHWARQRAQQQLAWFDAALRAAVWDHFVQAQAPAIARLRAAVADGSLTPSAAAERLTDGPTFTSS